MRACLVTAVVLLISCDARDFWRDRAPEEDRSVEDTSQCQKSSDCRDTARPVCQGSLCVPCNVFTPAMADSECKGRNVPGSALCVTSGANAGQCKECTDAAKHCPGDTFACVSNECTDACTLHSQCASLVCDVYSTNSKGTMGQCMPEKQVVYVNKSMCMGTWPGTRTMPVCTIAQGVTLLTADKRVIRVLPGEYEPASLADVKSVALYGSAGESGRTRIHSGMSAVDAVAISGMSDVTLDGFEIAGAGTGLSCKDMTATLRLRRSTVTESVSAVAVDITAGCVATLDRNVIQGNSQGALRLDNAPRFVVTNNFIVKNSSNMMTSNVIISRTSSGTFRFNTVADNSSTMVAGGIDCGTDTRIIEDTIVTGNTPKSSSQFSGDCSLVNTVVGSADTVMNGMRGTPVFNMGDPLDYRLKKGDPKNMDCCIDKAQNKPGVDHDIDGTKRPQGNGYDIGAHEVH